MRRLTSFLSFMALATFAMANELDRFNVVWTSPSANSAGSMPYGNGEIGMNIWAEPDGDLLILVSRTDAWSEACRLLKVGRIRVKMTPNPFRSGLPFKQELRLREGRVLIKAADLTLSIAASPTAGTGLDVAEVTGSGSVDRKIAVSYDVWRTERRELKGEELVSSWTMNGSPTPVFESGDTVTTGTDWISVIHRNESSVVPLSLKHQGLEEFADKAPDPLKDREFGLIAGGPRGEWSRNGSQLERQAKGFCLRFASFAGQPAPSEVQRTVALRAENISKAAAKWWSKFWDRSYIFVSGDRSPIVPTTKHALRIGADSGGGNVFWGRMAAVSYIPKALTATDIARLARSRSEHLDQGFLVGREDASQKGDLRIEGNEVEFLGAHLTANAPHEPDKGFTASAWVRQRSDHPVGRIFDRLTAGHADGWLLDTHPGSTLRLIVGTQELSAPRGSVPADTWVHVAAIADPRRGISLFVNGKEVAATKAQGDRSAVTEAYILQRYMAACGGRGRYPIKFNGSIFTVEPTEMGVKQNPDWRRWGGDFWWQNTRLPYGAMVPAGDEEMMQPLFRMYEDLREICELRARAYYGGLGVYFPETMNIFGLYSNNDYGWDRTGVTRDLVKCPWWMYAWNQSLELVDLMLDYYAATGDREFAEKRIWPMADSALRYFESRFITNGKMRIDPTQAAETYWFEVVNDTPSVAGLWRIITRLEGLPGANLSQLATIRASLPPIPIRNGKIAPAEQNKDQRNNVENPETYAIWPFRIYGLGRPDLELARKTFRERIERSNAGWQYEGQQAALLGLTDDARDSLLAKVKNSNPKYRWPATWGPNYDWLPDQCHGSNIMMTLQTMALQETDGKLHLLPAWPTDWDVKLRLRASRGTVVEADYKGGQLVKAKVTPASRQKDLVFASGQ